MRSTSRYPFRLGYNTATNRVFFAATGTGHEDAYTITLTDPQENIFVNQLTFGPLTGTAAQFNFIGLRDIIGSGLPEHIVFTGGTVTAEVAASNGVSPKTRRLLSPCRASPAMTAIPTATRSHSFRCRARSAAR